MNDPMTAADPVQLFRETWTTYQKIIASDYMVHRELTRAIASSLMTLPDTPLSVLDLGCGDASQITGILNAHHIAEYRGCDLLRQFLILIVLTVWPPTARRRNH